MTKAERSRNLRWRKPALAELNWCEINQKLDEIAEACSDVHWAYDDDDALINALDGDEEEAWEFKMVFSAIEAEAYQLSEQLVEICQYEDDIEKTFNDFSVALMGDTFQQVGYDDYQENYFSLTSYEENLAYTEAGKRVMKLTKADMLSQIGRILGIILAFQNIELKYEYLKATIDIFKDKNMSILQQIKDIESEYESANDEGFFGSETKKFDRMIANLPETIWIT